MKRLAILLILLLATALGMTLWLGWGAIRFWTFAPQEIGRLIGPVVLVALMMERSLEVLLTPWRQQESDRLKAAGQEAALMAYKSETQRIAFMLGMTLGLLMSLMGVRMLGAFLDPETMGKLKGAQQQALGAADALLTGAVLAGGADWLHQFVTVFTSYFDKAKAG